MLIVGICGSPKSENSNTGFLLEKALGAASDELSDSKTKQAATMYLEISDYEIRHCTGCDSCVRKKPCPESEYDDMPKIEEILLKADAILIAAPSYFTSVPGVLKDFMDRSRYLKMQNNKLKDKLFGTITYAGLRYGGQEHVVDVLNRFALGHGMIVVGSIGNPVKDGTFGSGSLQTDEGRWRLAKGDPLAIESCQLLGKRIAVLAKQLNGMI